ncbi:B-cell receptor CD22 isoform 2-T3 [Odontesthes bonariensis]
MASFNVFDTNKYGWRSKGSVYLSVTELHAEVKPQRARAGDNVTLNCRTSCHYPNIVWLRDGHLVTKPKFTAKAEDAGYYSCCVEGHKSVQSDPMALAVWYSPLNVSIEVSHGEYLTEGSNVSLTCSSAANPAADAYTWYRSGVSSSNSLLRVGSGQVLTISPVEASHNGLYLCQAQNRLGKSNSTAVLLAVGEEGLSRYTVLKIGVLVIVVLLLPSLVIIWAWRRRRNSRNSASDKETDSHDYENILSITEVKITTPN